VTGQALNLTRSATIVWRHKIVAGTLIALGLVGNTALTLAQPEVYTSSALVMISPDVNLNNQAVVVTSVPVLSRVLLHAGLGLSYHTLLSRVQAAPAGYITLSIRAEGDTAQQAERTANAVTSSYLAYVTSTANPVGQQPAELLRRAATAVAKPRTTRVFEAAWLGALAGVLVALIAVLAIWRDDPRLRTRDDIADSIGVPVLASLRAKSPGDAVGWARLLEHYQPGAADVWSLKHTFRSLGILPGSGRGGGGSAVVLSLSGDNDALALGPQLAAFAAAEGIPTALAIGQVQDTKAATALRAACVAVAGRGPHDLRVTVANHDDAVQVPAQTMTIGVDVLDGKAPRVADAGRADATVLAVTAGAVTSEQLTRVVASAAGDGRAIVGVLVVNPDPGDQTTGRQPRLARSQQQSMPTRMHGGMTESRR
jgi:capsular polysaccharide biosynthesis protein